MKAPVLLIASGALLMANVAGADVTVEGRKLPWTATIPSGWVGGTYEKIEKILAEGGTDSGKKKLDEILRPMLREAKEIDALFYHLDVQGTGTKTLSSLRINVVPLDLAPFAEEGARTVFWNSFAKQLQGDFPDGKIEVTRSRSGTAGERKAYQGTFLATLPAGGKVYTVVLVIAYAPGKAHVWRLRADSEKFPDRVKELEAIVNSLKYRSE
ncbi:MAG: hypothetical protein QOG51_1369 [Verrucomicrobiota bacterium]